MKTKVLQNPSHSEARNLIDEGVRQGRVVEIFGKCDVEYEGRAEGYLPPGERVCMLKPDGTLLVHKKEKRNPVNWQPPGSNHSTKIEDGNLEILSTRQNPRELLEVSFSEIYLVSSLDVEDKRELDLEKDEESMQDEIMKNPEIVEDGFEVVQREKKTGAGYIDVLGRDQDGNTVVVELKRKRVGPKAVTQLQRYIDIYEDKVDEGHHVRGILVAPSLTDTAKTVLKENGLEFMSLEPQERDNLEDTSLTDF